MNEKCRIWIICAAILFLSCFAGTASATSWSVDDSGGANFTVIQDAINKASAGDTIIVYPGVYYENVVVDKSVTLKGIGHPVVNASGKGNAITLSADGITLEGFNVTSSGSLRADVGIRVISNNNIITGNIVSNNRYDIALYSSCNNTITANTLVNGGLYVNEPSQTVEDNIVNGKPLVYLKDVSNYKVEDAGQVVLVNCSNITIENLDLSNIGVGIDLWDSEDCTISNNTVCNTRYSICLTSSGNNTITGNTVCYNSQQGIYLTSSCNCTISNNNVSSNNRYGIYLTSSCNCTISNNNVSSNSRYGIYLTSSCNNAITSNTFVNNSLSINPSYLNTVEDNIINGKPLVYLRDVSNYKIEDAGQVVLVNCSNITIENLDLSNTSVGIELWDTEDSTISNNKVCSNSGGGIHLESSSNNNTLSGNNVHNNNKGISLSSSSNNTITGNNVSNNNRGIHLSYSSNNNTISGNNVCNNKDEGIHLYYSSNNNTITGNNVRNNDRGISLYYSSNNTITGNNVCNNSGNDIDLYSYSNNNTITGNTFVSGGLSVRGSYQNTVEDNTVNGKPLVYLEDVSNYKIEDAGQVVLLNCNNVTVEDLDLSNTSVGIELWNTEDSTISNNKVCNNSGGGIDLESSSNNNTITGNNVRNNKNEGIDLESSSNNNIITGNNVSNNNKGIRLSSSSNNTITGNNVYNNNGDGINLYSSSDNNAITGNTFVSGGLSIRGSFQNTVEDNTVNGKPLVYLKDVSNYKIEDAGQVILVNCSNIRVKNLDLSNTSVGIYLWETKDCIVSNNTLCNNSGGGIDLKSSSNNNTITGNNVCSNNGEGIDLYYSSNNTLTGNNVSNNNGDGIRLSSSSDNNAITGNNVYNNNWGGISLSSSSNNTITGNNVCNNNKEGIDLDDSSNNTITGNTVSNNDDYFNLWYYSSNNIFYRNNFINNTDNFSDWDGETEEIDEEIVTVKEGIRGIVEAVKELLKSIGISHGNWGSTNTWNSTEKITYTYNGSTYTNYLGNYWSDYEEKYPDAEEVDTTGIWDTPYSIYEDKDIYPLMEPWERYLL